MTDKVTASDTAVKSDAPIHPNQALLDRLHADSQPTGAELAWSATKNTLIDGALTAPAAIGPVNLMRTVVMGYKVLDASAATAGEMLGTASGREANAIKQSFKEQLPPEALKTIEKGCEPSTSTKVWKGLGNVYGDGVVPLLSGMALAPVTGGWSIPVGLGLGAANGIRKYNNDVNYLRSKCQVDEMRKMLTSW